MIRIKQRNRASRRSGFTLAEVMVSLFILTLAVLSMTYFFGTMARATMMTENVTQATELAQDKLEALLEQTRGTMAEGRDVVSEFRRSWTLSNETAHVVVYVKVEWDVLGSDSRSVSLRTIRAR